MCEGSGGIIKICLQIYPSNTFDIKIRNAYKANIVAKQNNLYLAWNNAEENAV
jgi:hypothetical protein